MEFGIDCRPFKSATEEEKKALEETRFRDVPLTVLLEDYFGETLITNQKQKAREKQQKEAFWNRIIGEPAGEIGTGYFGNKTIIIINSTNGSHAPGLVV